MEPAVEPLLDDRPEVERVGPLRAGDPDADAVADRQDADDVPLLVAEQRHADLADERAVWSQWHRLAEPSAR